MKRSKNIREYMAILAAGLSAVFSIFFMAVPVVVGHHVDPQLAVYRSEKALRGEITSRGSDTMRCLMFAWAEAFQKYHSKVNFDIQAEGSGTAPTALLTGTSQIGPMSRKMKKEEYKPFMEKFGSRPVAIGIGLDTLAVYINNQNPLKRLSLVELDAIFSSTRNGGHFQDIVKWWQLGLNKDLANKSINLYTRNTLSGTFEYFRKRALFKGKYKDSIQMQPDSVMVINRVGNDPAGIGYSGIGYKTGKVKTLSLSEKPDGNAYSASHKNVYPNLYPLSRPLYIYVLKTTNQPIPDTVRAFISFVLSRQGQQIIMDTGYMPLSAKVAERQADLIR